MLYAILCYHDEDAVGSWTKEQDAAVLKKLAVVQDKLAKQGRLGPVARLLPTTAATTLRKDDPPLVLDGRWLPGLTVTTDRPAVACLASQYAGWRLDRDGYFAMGSGPGRALIRAEDLYDDLDWDEQASAAVLCLETRDAPPAEVADFIAQRAGVAGGARAWHRERVPTPRCSIRSSHS